VTAGKGTLRRVLEHARHELRCGRNKLTVLSTRSIPIGSIRRPDTGMAPGWLSSSTAPSAWVGASTGAACTTRLSHPGT